MIWYSSVSHSITSKKERENVNRYLTVREVAEQIREPLRLTQNSAIRKVYTAIDRGFLKTVKVKERIWRSKHICTQEAVDTWLGSYTPEDEPVSQCG
jgi:hypothetical protein